MTDFAALGVPAPLVSVLTDQGKTSAFPIQQDTLPDTLEGRDVLGRGKTGSGKTLAFSIPMVARLGSDRASKRRGRPRGLVLAPTRELATQIAATLVPLAEAYGLSTVTIFGGVNQNRQVSALNAGVDIVVACPGRLEDLMGQGFVNLDAVEITVLDEADHMADLGFLPGVTRILSNTPGNGQRLLFSATLDNGVDKLVKRFMHNPVLHSVDDANSHVDQMTHHIFAVPDQDAKNDLVMKLARGRGRRIMFMRTKHHAKKMAKKLTAAGIPAVDLHGNLSQNARDRNLAAFSSGDVKVLVATDVAARGVHVDNVELVVHIDPPAEHKAYLHRSGRTARAGAEGTVATIMLDSQRKDTVALLKKAAISAKPVDVTVTSPVVVDLVGEEADFVKPVIATPSRGGGQSQGANAQRKRARRAGSSADAGSAPRQGGRGGRRGQQGQHADAQGAPVRGSGRHGARGGAANGASSRGAATRSSDGRASAGRATYSTSSPGAAHPGARRGGRGSGQRRAQG